MHYLNDIISSKMVLIKKELQNSMILGWNTTEYKKNKWVLVTIHQSWMNYKSLNVEGDLAMMAQIVAII